MIAILLGIACVWLSYTMYVEHMQEKRQRQLKEWFEQEKRKGVEKRVQETVKMKSKWWDSFNIDLYVKFLERRK